jgi:exodeoxyribonuclease VII large subunit
MDELTSVKILELIQQKAELEDEPIFTPKDVVNKLYEIIHAQKELKNIWVEGEVYNFKKNTQSGHIYFSLKDEHTNLECVYFLQNQVRDTLNGVEIKDGKIIRAFGDIRVYKKNGHCQLNVEKISDANSIGNILRKILATYKKLQEEGLFALERKKKIPEVPLNLGIATSDSGAALRDIIKVAKSRFPQINIYIAPCHVQGEKAKESIINAIKILNNPVYKIDVIIVGRGGGSFEDLIIFSEEDVVRAFADSTVPVVSAVGHQIDRPLCEYAADVVAITPTEAAQKCVPIIEEKKEKIEYYIKKIQSLLIYRLNFYKEKWHSISKRYIWKEPQNLFLDYYQYLDQSEDRLKKNFINLLKQKYFQLQILEEKLKQLNPHAPLKRGYAYVTDKQNKIIKKGSEIKQKDKIFIHFLEDVVHAKVENIQKKE